MMCDLFVGGLAIEPVLPRFHEALDANHLCGAETNTPGPSDGGSVAFHQVVTAGLSA